MVGKGENAGYQENPGSCFPRCFLSFLVQILPSPS